jgi:hypothetical protein
MGGARCFAAKSDPATVVDQENAKLGLWQNFVNVGLKQGREA